MAESNDRQQELEALTRSYKMMEMDRQKYSEESQVSRRPPVPPRPTPPRPTPLLPSPLVQDRIGSVGNQFALTTLLGALCVLPVFLLTEGSKLGELTQL